MSSPQNPWVEPGLPVDLPPAPVVAVLGENPGWSGWDVLSIAFLTVASIIVFLFFVTFAGQRFFLPRMPVVEVAKLPLVTLVAQLLAYILVGAFMVTLVKRQRGTRFGQAIGWNWPGNWPFYVLGGFVLSIGLQGLAHLLPMPKDLPIDRFFQTSAEAWALSIFGMTVAPLFEELFFRGFLYPVLTRRLGVVFSVILTSASFGLIHAPQLGRAWGPVLVVFMVGLALTITRAITKSVAAGVVMHVAYNGTISVLLFMASDGFRHLDKLQ